MTIASLIGQVDMYSAGVAVAFAAGATVFATTLVARHETRRKTDQQFELEQLRLRNSDAENTRRADIDREIQLGKIAANRQIEIARIEGDTIQHAKQVSESGDD